MARLLPALLLLVVPLIALGLLIFPGLLEPQAKATFSFESCRQDDVLSIVVTGQREDGSPIMESSNDSVWLCSTPVNVPDSLTTVQQEEK